MRHPATARELFPHETRTKDLTPRVKLAARLYATGVAKTKAQAADMAGLTRGTFYIVSTTEPKVSDLIAQIDRELEGEHIDMGKLMQKLGRRSIRNIAQIAEQSDNPVGVRLKAAQDLADRSPETAKITKFDVAVSTPISTEQFEAMRAALLESAKNKLEFAEAASGNYITVTDEATSASLDLVRERAPLGLLPGGEGSD